MKRRILKVGIQFLALTVGFWVFIGVPSGYTQDIRWLRVGQLQSPINRAAPAIISRGLPNILLIKP
jgi:hypothetical protein